MIDIILFAAFAVFIGVKLYNALGRKDFEDEALSKKIKDSNVVAFPGDEADKIVEGTFKEVPDDAAELEKKYGAELVAKINDLRKIDASFNDKDFLNGAKKAFEIIITSFAKGDREALKPLLGKNIYESLSQAIAERETSGNTEQTTLVSILKVEIKDISLEKSYATIVVEIVSEQINLVKNKAGEIIEGNASHVDKITESWTFGRNLSSPNPNWELVASANGS
jgi:predicted lipid-binding transport protein (Tim44 family)